MDLSLDEAVKRLYNFKPTDINNTNKKEIRKAIKRHCPKLLAPNTGNQSNKDKIQDDGVITVVALGRKYNIPLLTWFFDTYHRMAIDNWISTSGQLLSPLEFMNKYKFTRNLKHTSPKLYEIFKHVVDVFHKRLFTFPEIAANDLKIDDDLPIFVDIKCEIDNLVRGIAINRTNINTGPVGIIQPFPCQIDVWIIPKNVINDTDHDTDVNDDDDDDDPDPVNDKPLKKWKTIFNKVKTKIMGDKSDVFKIEKKLKANCDKKIINHYEHIVLDRNGTDWNWYNVLRQRLTLSNKINSLKAFHRYVLIIDRRETNDDKIHVYFYDAPKGSNKIKKKHHRYLRCSNFFNSQCILPHEPDADLYYNNSGSKVKDIGLFNDENGYMFGLSYHINSSDSIATYWTCLGHGFRMLSIDMKYVWPHYFMPKRLNVKNQVNQVNQDVGIIQFNEFEDIPFQRFYHITTGINDLYKRHKKLSKPFGWKPKILTLQEQLSGALKSKYSDATAITFNSVIEEEAYETDDIASDIEDPDGSSIIDELIEQDTNLTDNDAQPILNILIPIIQKHKQLQQTKS